MSEGSRFLEEYEPVQDRIAKFYEKYPEGRIVTELVSDPADWSRCRYKAYLYRDFTDEVPLATGHATETADDSFINRSSHEENCETSAVGRALANAGFAAHKRPSREEMAKVEKEKVRPKEKEPASADPSATHPTLQLIWDKVKRLGIGREEMKAYLLQEFGVPTSKALNDTQLAQLAEIFEEIHSAEDFKRLSRPLVH